MSPISLLPTVSETIFLQCLWQISWVLAVTSMAIAGGLVLWRFLEDHRNQRLKVRRVELERMIWGVLSTPVQISQTSMPSLKQDDIMLICDVALDILRPLRGEESARIVKLLESWPIGSYVKRTLERGRRGQRIRMLSLLAHFDDEGSLALLKQSIGAKDFYVQLAALRSLAARNANECLPDILVHLARSKRQNPTMLADVLRRFGEPALPMLSSLASKAVQPEIRLAAIRALDAIGSLEAVSPLVTLAADASPEIRAAAVNALGHLGDLRAEPIVIAALGDMDDGVRVQAARAAGRLHLQSATPILAHLLSDAFWWVRYRAAEALYSMGTIGQTFLQMRSKEVDRAGHAAAQLLAEKEAA